MLRVGQNRWIPEEHRDTPWYAAANASEHLRQLETNTRSYEWQTWGAIEILIGVSLIPRTRSQLTPRTLLQMSWITRWIG